jgi:hypothetical protein
MCETSTLKQQLRNCGSRLDALEAIADEEDGKIGKRAKEELERLQKRRELLRDKLAKLTISHPAARKRVEKRYKRALEQLNADLERRVLSLLRGHIREADTSCLDGRGRRVSCG